MPLTIEPAISVKVLSEAKIGSLVLIDGAYAFVANNPSQPGLRVLATYDKADSKFKYQYADTSPSIVEFSGSLVVRPDFSTAFSGRPSQASTTELFLDGTNLLIVMHMPSDFRLVNLSNGQFGAARGSYEMFAFRKWGLGVKDGSALASVVTAF